MADKDKTQKKEKTLDEQKERDIWEDVRRFWFYARLPNPKLIEDTSADDLTIPEDVKILLQSEEGPPEFITYIDNQLYLNMEKILKDFRIQDESELERLVEFLEMHGVGHYSLIPYDLLTKLVLTHNSAKALEYQGIAKGIEAQKIGANISNVFEDIVDNTFIIENGEEKGFSQNKENTTLAYDKINERNKLDPKRSKKPSKTWDIYMRICEKIWDEEGRWVDKKKKFSEEQEKAAERIYVLMKDDMYNSRNWERRVYRFSQILAPFIKEDGQQGEDLKMFEGESSGQGNRLKKMLQQLEDMKKGKDKKSEQDGKDGKDPKEKQKDLEKKIKQMQKQIENEVKGLANKLNKGGNNRNLLKDYKELLVGTGISDDEKMAERWLYRDLANNYSVKFQPLLTVAGKAHPFTPKRWCTSDPPLSLDLQYTIQTAGVAIPNVTTKKWRFKETYGFKEGEQPPDLYIMLDSSGSMPDPTQTIAPAPLGATAAAQSARNVGAKVAVKNFSGDTSTLDETEDEDAISDYILLYKGGGTNLPTEDLVEWAKNPEMPKQFLLITDTAVSNFDESYPYLKELMEMNPKNRGAIFCMGHWQDDYVQKLQDIGYEVFKINSENDLCDIIVGKTREVYEYQGREKPPEDVL